MDSTEIKADSFWGTKLGRLVKWIFFLPVGMLFFQLGVGVILLSLGLLQMFFEEMATLLFWWGWLLLVLFGYLIIYGVHFSVSVMPNRKLGVPILLFVLTVINGIHLYFLATANSDMIAVSPTIDLIVYTVALMAYYALAILAMRGAKLV